MRLWVGGVVKKKNQGKKIRSFCLGFDLVGSGCEDVIYNHLAARKVLDPQFDE